MKLISMISVFVCLSGIAFGQNDGRATVHVFPQFADGKFSDGTSYRSAFGFTAVTNATTGSCTAKLNGITTVVQNPSGNSFTLGSLTIGTTAGLGGFFAARTLGTAAFQSGYLVLTCSNPQTAQVVYSFYNANGVKLSEATVFSSPPGTLLQIFADQRDGANLGLAIVNDTAAPVTVTVSAFFGAGLAGSAQVTIPATSNYVKFLNEIIPQAPTNLFGTVTIASTTPVEAIGLRFTGAAFTTIPSTVIVQ